MSTITYRTPTAADIDPLCALASETFVETFGHLYSADDLSTFLEEVFGPNGMPVEMADPAFAFRVAEADGAMIGYCKVGPLYMEIDTRGRRALELRQLYVRRPYHGAGVAAELMTWALAELRRRGAEDAYLSVWSGNDRAKRFYARYGFVEVGRHPFMVGEQADDDRIMRAELVARPEAA